MTVPKKSRILYVDDHEDSCEMISLLLELSDPSCQVICLNSSREMLDLLKTERFDIYILDYSMPEISGVDLCRTIRRTDLHTPILFYSGMAQEKFRREALDAGANDYLVKPNGLDGLPEVVKTLLAKSQNTVQA